MSDKSLRFLLFGEDRGAGKTFGKSATDAESASHRMGAAFHKLGGAVGGEFGELVSRIGESFDGLEGKQASLGAKLMGAGGAAAGVGTALSLISASDKQASDQLKAAVDASGHSYEQYAEEFEGVIKAQENFGHSAVDTQTALQKMTQATGDPKKAIEQMGVVANIAAARHISLSDAADLVDKVISGRGSRTLAEYNITMGKSKDKTKNAEDALAQLAKKVDGQASASVDNFGSKVGIIRTKLGDWTAQMGQTLGPALQTGGVAILALGTIIESGMGKAVVSGIASVGKFALSMGTMAVEAGVAFGAMVVEALAWGASMLVAGAMAILPFLPIIAAVALVGAAAFLLYKNWDTVWGAIKNVSAAAWHWIDDKVVRPIGAGFAWIGHAASSAVSWIGSHWQLLLAILTGPVGLAVLWIKDHWSTVTGVFGRVVDGLRTVFGKVAGFITAPFRLAFNTVSDLWNGTIGRMSWSVPSWVPVIGGNTISAPQLPHLAAGGTAQRGGYVTVGEFGPERMYLPGGASVVPLNRAASGGHGGLTVIVQGDSDPHGAARRIYQLLKDAEASGGLRLDFGGA